MFARCENPKNKSHPNYGGRGIYAAERFRDQEFFLNFIKTLPGWDNPRLTLDRIDNSGPYVPGNLRMATYQQQAGNCRPRRKRQVA